MQYLYTTEHVWVKIEADNRVRLGSTPYPFTQLDTGLASVELSVEVGDEITRDTVFGTLVSDKLSTLVTSPVSGVIIETNLDALSADISIANDSPYNRGWFIVIELSNPEELALLLSADEYFARYPEEV